MKKPKDRIKKVFEKVMENNGFNVGKAMREEGYSPESAKNPMQVTNSKSWAILSERYLPDDLVLDTHKQAFTANKLVTSPTEGDKQQPDWQTRMKAVELGYKVKGKLVDRTDLTSGDKPIPLLNGIYNNNSNQKADTTQEEN